VRGRGEKGACGIGDELLVAQALIHRGEEPPLSGPGPGGSGAVFFAGCSLGCVFCQNHQISQSKAAWPPVSEDQMVDMMFMLKDRGAVNINLVSPTPHVLKIAPAIARAKSRGLGIPVVYNSGGYDSLEALAVMDGLVDVYLPDAKLAPPAGDSPGDPDGRSMRLLGVGDYPWVNRAALTEMLRQVGDFRIGADGLAERGMLVRHLVLPDDLARTTLLLPWLKEAFGTGVFLSVMNQYFPSNMVKAGFNEQFRDWPGLGRPLSEREYDRVVGQMMELGFDNAFVQEEGASELMRPDFDKPDAFN
jgi:putative pyruvate formate lyase activating enzyme